LFHRGRCFAAAGNCELDADAKVEESRAEVQAWACILPMKE
jgi:hypothetical protein